MFQSILVAEFVAAMIASSASVRAAVREREREKEMSKDYLNYEGVLQRTSMSAKMSSWCTGFLTEPRSSPRYRMLILVANQSAHADNT